MGQKKRQLIPDFKILTPWQKAQREMVEEYLLMKRGNISAAARAVGISRPTFLKKMRGFGIKAKHE